MYSVTLTLYVSFDNQIDSFAGIDVRSKTSEGDDLTFSI